MTRFRDRIRDRYRTTDTLVATLLGKILIHSSREFEFYAFKLKNDSLYGSCITVVDKTGHKVKKTE